MEYSEAYEISVRKYRKEVGERNVRKARSRLMSRKSREGHEEQSDPPGPADS